MSSINNRVAFFVESSKNEKTGDVSATYATIDGSCPKDCVHKNNGCYAQTGMVGIHTFRLNAGQNKRTREDARIVAREEARGILAAIRDGRNKRPMRLHVAGDARTPSAARTLANACENWNNPVWTYTHAWKNVSRENWGNISVLASVDKIDDISMAFDRGYAPTIVVKKHPEDGKAYNLGAFKVIPCPAQTRENITCIKCKLCWKDSWLKENKAIISFAAHGVQKRKLNVIM